MILFTCHNGFMCNSMYKKGKLPGAPLTNFNDEGGGGGGGVQERFIFYTQRNHNFRICLSIKVTAFFSIPQKSLSPFFTTPKNPFVFFATQKNPGVFYRPKKSLLAKISDSIKSFDPPPPTPVIKMCEWGPWGRAFS